MLCSKKKWVVGSAKIWFTKSNSSIHDSGSIKLMLAQVSCQYYKLRDLLQVHAISKDMLQRPRMQSIKFFFLGWEGQPPCCTQAEVHTYQCQILQHVNRTHTPVAVSQRSVGHNDHNSSVVTLDGCPISHVHTSKFNGTCKFDLSDRWIQGRWKQ